MSGWFDLPLSDLGRRQALEAAHSLAQCVPGAPIYTSPLARAYMTAEIIAAEVGSTIRTSDNLREIYCGEVDGLSVREVQARYPELWQRNLQQEDDDFRWPGGESYAELRKRCLAAVRAIAKGRAGKSVIIVTHAGAIAQVVGWLRGFPAARWSCFRPDNGRITAVAWRGERGSVLRFNELQC
jgi:broad specificity phosphatase PhoE